MPSTDTVKLAYSSGRNISFRGTVDTGEVVTQKLHELVDIGVKED